MSDDIGKRIHTKLAAATGVTATVDVRIYAGDLPQKTKYPAITYTRESETVEHAFSSDPGNERSRFEVIYWDVDYWDAIAGRDQVRSALLDWSTTTGSPTLDGTHIEGQWDRQEVDRKEHTIYQAVNDFTFYVVV